MPPVLGGHRIVKLEMEALPSGPWSSLWVSLCVARCVEGRLSGEGREES